MIILLLLRQGVIRDTNKNKEKGARGRAG